jgi:hypothetical protein
LITGQSSPGADVEANDVDERVRALSQWIDSSAVTAPRLVYYLWLSNDTGSKKGGALDLHATINGGNSLFDGTRVNVSTKRWERREVDFSEMPSQFQLIVTALPKIGASVFEVALDDLHFVNGCPAFNSDGSNLDGDGDRCDGDDGIVQGVRLGGERILWAPEVGSDDYNLYRGHVGSESFLPFAVCRMSGIRTTYWVDPILPIPGDAYFHVVTRTAKGVEGSPGTKSDGTERAFEASCP